MPCFYVLSVGKWNLEGKDGVLCGHDKGKGHEFYCPEQLDYTGVRGVFASVKVK